MRTVILDFDIEGFHHFPNAPSVVSFLEHDHRHLFQIRAGLKVDDLNREKEIFIMQEHLKEYLIESYGSPCQFEAMSCEMIARTLYKHFDLEYCSVFEDNENGAEIYE